MLAKSQPSSFVRSARQAAESVSRLYETSLAARERLDREYFTSEEDCYAEHLHIMYDNPGERMHRSDMEDIARSFCIWDLTDQGEDACSDRSNAQKGFFASLLLFVAIKKCPQHMQTVQEIAQEALAEESPMLRVRAIQMLGVAARYMSDDLAGDSIDMICSAALHDVHDDVRRTACDSLPYAGSHHPDRAQQIAQTLHKVHDNMSVAHGVRETARLSLIMNAIHQNGSAKRPQYSGAAIALPKNSM